MRRLAVATTLLVVACVLVPQAHALLVSCAGPTPGGDWPMMGQNLQSARSQPAETDIKPPLVPVWTFDADRWTHTSDNEVTGYPVVAGGCVYVGSSSGNDSQGRHRPSWVFALNADTGDVVWETRVPGGVYATVAVDDGVVYAFVSRVGAPLLVALDASTGRVRWSITVDHQPGSDAVSSPVVYDGLVWVGVSGTAAETSANERTAFEGSSVLVATRTLRAPEFSPVDAELSTGRTRIYRAGEIVRKLYTIPPRQWQHGYAGGSQWGTIAIDPRSGYGYEGTGNPFDYHAEYKTTNAVIKIDLDRRRPTFGQLVGSYKGTVEEYAAIASQKAPCDAVDHVSGVFAAGVECARLDLDFGATPNLLRIKGHLVVAAGQKSGVLHFIDGRTMRPIAKTAVGVPSQVGGVVGSPASDGHHLYGPHTVGGYLWSVDATTHRLGWLSPTADGIHWGPPVTLANHVLYTVDLSGCLDAYDASTGALLMHLPMQVGSDEATMTNPPLSWGGVSVARHLVFASVGVGLTSAGLPSMPDGFVIAYSPLHALERS